MQDQTADLTWRSDRVPVSTQFDDPYFSLENGLEETRHVFLAGNDLPARFCDGFHVAELGFGTGLNFVTTVLAWRLAGCQGHLRFTSFEAYPMQTADMRRALKAFDNLSGVDTELCAVWHPGGGVFEIAPDVTLHVIIGDVQKTLPKWQGCADAWYLDGFSPAKNPQMWSEELLNEVGLHTAASGTCATYTAAGFVRRGLEKAGFEVARVTGYGRKRHMTRGWLRP